MKREPVPCTVSIDSVLLTRLRQRARELSRPGARVTYGALLQQGAALLLEQQDAQPRDPRQLDLMRQRVLPLVVCPPIGGAR